MPHPLHFKDVRHSGSLGVGIRILGNFQAFGKELNDLAGRYVLSVRSRWELCGIYTSSLFTV